MIEKRGQFYLMAALIIIVLILGFATVSNYVKTQKYTKTYDFGQELQVESAQVLDYGIYNQEIGTDQMRNLLAGFIEEYSKHGDLDELYFVFGNAQKVNFMGYQQLESQLSINVSLNNGGTSVLKIDKQQVGYQEFSGNGIELVNVIVNHQDSNDEYNFQLKPGENFYFILSQVVESGKHVEVGGS